MLEVTSPGVDRPLTEQRHWRRARGLLVKAVLRDGGTVEGRITDVTETEVELDGTRRIPLADLVKGRVQLEFGRPREPARPVVEMARTPLRSATRAKGEASWTST